MRPTALVDYSTFIKMDHGHNLDLTQVISTIKAAETELPAY